MLIYEKSRKYSISRLSGVYLVEARVYLIKLGTAVDTADILEFADLHFYTPKP